MQLRLLSLIGFLPALLGASFDSPNFTVHAPTAEIAARVAEAAEESRKTIAEDWLGREVDVWPERCEVFVTPEGRRPDGVTTFRARYGAGTGLRIDLSGPMERILDSVLPHEMTHAILASHFKAPLPRWADEGAATLSEVETQRHRQSLIVREIVDGRHRIPLRELLSLRDYPHQPHDKMTLYCIGFSLSDFLVQSGGKPRYVEFLESSQQKDWDDCLKSFYGFENVEAFEAGWLKWLSDAPTVPVDAVPVDAVPISGDVRPDRWI
ncbi:MAG: hypothetical protein WD066_10195 [Planctomycetaceae bacterium]